MSLEELSLSRGGTIINAQSRAADITSLVLDMRDANVLGLQMVSSSGNFSNNSRTTFCITVVTGLAFVRVSYVQASAIVVIEQSNDGTTWDRCKDTDGNESYGLASSADTLTVKAYRKMEL